MKSAKDAHFWQVDHKIKKMAAVRHGVLMRSRDAWEKHSWTREYLGEKPKEGYFVWVREQPDGPLLTCVNIATKNTRQKFRNLLVVEEGLKIELEGFCGNTEGCIKGYHRASGKIIIKKNSSVKYKHVHAWEEESVVEPNYEFLLQENSSLDYVYKTSRTPKSLTVRNKITCLKGAKVKLQILADCKNTRFTTEDEIVLQGEGSSGISRLRLIARKDSDIKACSKIVAKSPSSGHLDCQSLVTDKNSRVTLVPEVVCEDKDAQITHEASIGKVSEEQLNYLRTRGLNEQQAINLITAGFLKV
ncbi:SufD family Fe-S cluster assembly protein [Candidatus Woesebacteria bacterium]|nr:SufD family Fe-S cluster assembly protein [Candidatus Woesebacteria bacterium]